MTFSMWTPAVARFFAANAHLRSVVLFGIEVRGGGGSDSGASSRTQTHVCIYQTALDFLAHDYQVWVLADGVDSQDAPTEVQVALDVRALLPARALPSP